MNKIIIITIIIIIIIVVNTIIIIGNLNELVFIKLNLLEVVRANS